MKYGKSFEIQLAYIHGRIESQLEAFAASLGIAPKELAVRLAGLLLGQEGGEVLRTGNRVPALSGKAPKRGTSARKVAVARRTRNAAPKTKYSAYWSRMTPEERSAEMRRRQKVAQRNRAVA